MTSSPPITLISHLFTVSQNPANNHIPADIRIVNLDDLVSVDNEDAVCELSLGFIHLNGAWELSLTSRSFS